VNSRNSTKIVIASCKSGDETNYQAVIYATVGLIIAVTGKYAWVIVKRA
jgi:hypothetical protein